jgi:carbon-monoxide dehydrogenase medium subunit
VILTALDASFVATSRGGTRTIEADAFFVDVFTTALEPSEVLTEIRVPIPPAGSGTGYAKLGNPASGYVVISAGALIGRDAGDACSSARIAIGGLEAIAAAASHAGDGAEFDDEPYAGADYKRHMATVYAQRAIETAVRRMS